jgi:hypothetical protein
MIIKEERCRKNREGGEEHKHIYKIEEIKDIS